MFTILVILLGIFLACKFGNDGDTTAMWVVIGLAAFVVFGIYISHEDDKAYVNRMHYWAMDGKDRAKARHRWEAEARAEEERERERKRPRERMQKPMSHEEHMAYLRDRQRAYAEKQRRESERNGYCGRGVFVCHRCGRRVEANWDRIELQGGTMKMYECPVCRTKNITKLGGT